MLDGVVAHRGDHRRRLLKHCGDPGPQRVDLGYEVVDYRADVGGDLFDLVFVLVRQDIPNLFDPGQRVADARQQVQDRRVHLVDLCCVAAELGRDRLALRHDARGAGIGIRKSGVDSRPFGNLLGTNRSHRPGFFLDFGERELCAGVTPGRRRGAQFRRIRCRPDHSDEGGHPSPARRGAVTGSYR